MYSPKEVLFVDEDEVLQCEPFDCETDYSVGIGITDGCEDYCAELMTPDYDLLRDIRDGF